MTQKQLERQISQTYAQAQKEIAKYTEDYFKKFQVRDEDKRQQVADGIITEDEYQDWLTGQKAYMARNDQLLKSVTEEYENADKTAEKWINGELPYAYVEGYNATGRGIEGEVTGYSFSMIDKNAVKTMMADGDIPITTYTAGTEKHTAYVSKKARQAITQGIIQGDSVKDVSKNVNKALGVVTDKERKATIRNTRTLMNSAHNSGAYESMAEASEDGIILDKQWLATKDERTRDSHAFLDGQIQKWNKPFSNGLMFPQDFRGEPSEVYNCRCSYREVVRGFYNKYTGKTEMLSEVPEEEYAKRSQEYWSKANAEKEAKKKSSKPTPVSLNEKGRQEVWNSWEEYREKYVGRAVSINDVDINSNFMYDTFDISKLPEEQQQEILDTLAKMNGRYYSPLNKVVTMDAKETMYSSAFASTRHDWRTANCEMRINPIKAQDTARLRELSDTGYSIKYANGRETEYLVTHEYGHSILNIEEQLPTKATNFVDTDFTDVKKARKEINDVYDRYRAERATAGAEYDALRKPLEEKVIFGTGDVTDEERRAVQEARERYEATKISEYADSNVEEFTAECFADAEMGENPSAYSLEVRDIIYKYFGKG